MTGTRVFKVRSRFRGLTLIELLISMVIGLVVVGAVIVSMVGSGKAGRFQEAYSQMNEDAQIASSILSREVQMAGYSQPTGFTDISGGAPTATFALQYANVPGNSIFGCDTGFTNPSSTAASTCGTGTMAAMEVAYQADVRSTVAVTVGGTTTVPTDCLGNSISGAAPWIARNRYYVNTSVAVNSSGRPELYCASNGGGGGQPIVENIEGMTVLYGVSLSPPATPAIPPPPQVVRYVTATQIAAVGAAEWGNVVSVRICLVVRSAERVLNSGGEDVLTYLDCSGTSQTSNDGYLRRAYFSTSTIRDRMP